MVIDSKGNLFEDRRKKDRRLEKEKSEGKNETERRKKDRRDPKNAYKA